MLLKDFVTTSSWNTTWMLCRWLWCQWSVINNSLTRKSKHLTSSTQMLDIVWCFKDSLYMAVMTPRATSANFWIYTNVMIQLWQNDRKGKAISIVPQRYKMRSWGSCHWVSQGALLSVSRKLNFSWWIRQECWHVQPRTADCLLLMVWFPAAARSARRVSLSVWSLRYHRWQLLQFFVTVFWGWTSTGVGVVA